jgi:hypothetical protein
MRINLFYKKCPVCGCCISVFMVGDKFLCSSCGAELRSNSGESFVISILLCGALVFPLIHVANYVLEAVGVSVGGYVKGRFLLGGLLGGVIFFVRPLFVRVWKE